MSETLTSSGYLKIFHVLHDMTVTPRLFLRIFY